jgi:hypothetical protein
MGKATLTGGRIVRNTADSDGGGVYVGTDGEVTVTGGVLAGNWAGSRGGGIYNNSAATLVNSTVSGNEAISDGGGIYHGGVTVVLTYTTVASNTAASGGGGVHVQVGTALVQNTIVAYNGPGNCSTGLTSNGHNLEDGASCGFTSPGDWQNANPELGPLADNGGDTLTHALLRGSPAIDQGICIAGITTDQRGVERPHGPTADCDIGAFEFASWDVFLPLAVRSS